MVNKKLKDIPPFKPYQNGQQPVYAENRADWDFLMRAIVHRDQLDLIIKDLVLKRDSEKNILMIKAVQDTIASQLQQMTSIAASQNEFFCAQSEALQMLMQSRPSPKSVPLQNFEGPALSLSEPSSKASVSTSSDSKPLS